MNPSSQHNSGSPKATDSKYTKWGFWEVHQLNYPDPPFYTPLPQYGPWDTELEARHMAELLTRLSPQTNALIAREFGQR